MIEGSFGYVMVDVGDASKVEESGKDDVELGLASVVTTSGTSIVIVGAPTSTIE